jgi:hypothetical protein
MFEISKPKEIKKGVKNTKIQKEFGVKRTYQRKPAFIYC